MGQWDLQDGDLSSSDQPPTTPPMAHRISEEDATFRAKFEACRFPASKFDHRAHVRLAYIYLTLGDVDAAHHMMRDALTSFLAHLKVDPGKYHETITRAWIMAVRHFMELSSDSDSADSFIDQNPLLLDADIMLTHYSAQVLFSAEARAAFVEPNLDPIPNHE
jgi:hypothetical protein